MVSYVDFDVTSQVSYKAAMGDAQVVVSALGASEGLNPLGYAKVDGFGVKNVMEFAAALSTVRLLVCVSSIGVGNPFGFPAAILNLFGGVLLWKDFSETAMRKAAKANGKDYFIVRPGGLERAKDDFKETHNLKLVPRGTLTIGVVSRLQIAELVAAAILNPDFVKNKTVEAVAETDAPFVEPAELLAKAKVDDL